MTALIKGYNQRWAYVTVASTITEGLIPAGSGALKQPATKCCNHLSRNCSHESYNLPGLSAPLGPKSKEREISPRLGRNRRFLLPRDLRAACEPIGPLIGTQPLSSFLNRCV